MSKSDKVYIAGEKERAVPATVCTSDERSEVRPAQPFRSR